MASASVSFGTLFSHSFSILFKLWKPIVLGYLIIGALMAISMFLSFVIIGIPLLIVVAWGATVYSFVVATKQFPDVKSSLSAVPSLMIPVLKVFILILVRSYMWIPLLVVIFDAFVSQGEGGMLGSLASLALVVLAFVYYPKLFFAPYIVVAEKKSANDAIRLSMDRTKGYWGTIVGYAILVSLIIGMVSIVFYMVFGGMMVGLISTIPFSEGQMPQIGGGSILMLIVSLALFFLWTAFTRMLPLIFFKELGDGMKHHPRK